MDIGFVQGNVRWVVMFVEWVEIRSSCSQSAMAEAMAMVVVMELVIAMS